MSTFRGDLCGLYMRTSGTYGSPTHEEITLVGDVNVDDSHEEMEADSRGSQGVNEFEPGRKALRITGQLRVNVSSSIFQAIIAAYQAREAVDIMALNAKKTVNGAIGYRMDMKIFSMGEDQTQGKVTYRDFTLLPCPSDNPKQTVVITGGAPVFTDIPLTPA